MGSIRVLVVADGDFVTNGKLGINMAPTKDVSDDTFTVSELVFLLRNNPATPILVDTAHRRNDPNATYANFNFATTVDLMQYDVLWLIGYEGNNDGFLYGAPITQAEVAAIAAFMDGGGGVYATGDHSGMGSYLCGQIPRVG